MKTKSRDENNACYTYRIVESIHLGGKVKQRTLLNLGSDFSIANEHWPQLCARIEQLLQNEKYAPDELFDLPYELDQTQEAVAQRYFQLILNKHAQPVDPDGPLTDASKSLDSASDYHQVDVNRAQAQHARSIGAETLALHALQQLQLDQKLTAFGFNPSLSPPIKLSLHPKKIS